MKRRRAAAVWVLVLMGAFVPARAFCKEEALPLLTLINEANSLNCMRVLVRGEVIGDVLPRGDHAWINIQDATGQMSVWAPRELAEKIGVKGDYNSIGDQIEVEGEFQRADKQLEGEMCVKAEDVRVVSPGQQVLWPVPWVKVETTVALGALMLAVLGMSQMIKKRKG